MLQTENQTLPPIQKVKRPIALIILIFVAFIALGMPDGLLGVGWPSIRAGFNVPLDSLGALLFTSMAGYLISSFSSGILMRRWGVGRLLIYSCLLTGAGLVGYTLVPSWWMMVLLGILAGLGAGAIDAGLNAYVANHFGPGLMQWLHASYGVGITTGPLLMTFALANYQNWKLAYLVVGGFQIVLMVSFILSLCLWQQPPSAADVENPTSPTPSARLEETMRQPRVWGSMALFFFYVGAEVTFGTWVYSLLTAARGVRPQLAGYFTSSFWFMFTIGRILAGLLTRRLNIQKIVAGCIIAALSGAVLLLLNLGLVPNLVAVGVIGFAFAPVFPGMMSATTDRVGARHADSTVGMQAAAGALGGTGLTSLVGVLARAFSLEVVPVVLIVFLVCLLGVYLIFKRKGQPGQAAG